MVSWVLGREEWPVHVVRSDFHLSLPYPPQLERNVQFMLLGLIFTCVFSTHCILIFTCLFPLLTAGEKCPVHVVKSDFHLSLPLPTAGGCQASRQAGWQEVGARSPPQFGYGAPADQPQASAPSQWGWKRSPQVLHPQRPGPQIPRPRTPIPQHA